MRESDINCVVSSCSKAGWDTYGARFLETFKQFWPRTVSLHLVSEDTLPIVNDGSLFLHDLRNSVAWRTFDQTYGQYAWARGDGSAKRPDGLAAARPGDRGHTFRYDAYKFSKKVFAIELIATHYNVGRLCWLDADVVTHAPVPESLLTSLLPNNYCLSCLSRVGYHSECGFVGYNLQHDNTRRFISAFSNLYVTGEVFKLAEWHDSWVFDWLRNKMMVPTFNIPHKSKGHP